jgi:hypothetical protein
MLFDEHGAGTSKISTQTCHSWLLQSGGFYIMKRPWIIGLTWGHWGESTNNYVTIMLCWIPNYILFFLHSYVKPKKNLEITE